MPGLTLSRSGLLPNRKGLRPARGCADAGGETNIPTCGPCEFPQVPDFITATLPNCTVPPANGEQCDPCLGLNGATIVLPHTSGSPTSCSYNLVIGTCFFGPGMGEEHEVRVSARINTSSVSLRADVTSLGAFPETKISISWFRGGLVIGPNCIGLSTSLFATAATGSSYGCNIEPTIGDAFVFA